ncbi:hypothetical protein KC19_5G015400 [Ceratodon purpureus]|uniref:Protein kinase domain-containing protein n=1 Tax=Ceratodon purpureus TaxID=3225 RepID=A0A8T0HZ34_CERPU|nr:hypothetical protein KC19_5G015400 [Ceratodon purpureus]
MSTLRRKSRISSSFEVDFLNLCTKNVRSIEDLVSRGSLLNQRQCLDLSTKLSKTTLNIRELVLHQAGSAVLFHLALENLYRSLEKARLLVQSCGKKDWWIVAVFQIQNENAFQEILLDVSLCYNTIYEQAKSVSEDWRVHPEDLRESSMFRQTTDNCIHELDQQDLRKRLEELASEPSRLVLCQAGSKETLKQSLAKYLLARMNYTGEQSEATTMYTCSEILWSKASEPSGTWGSSDFLGAGANEGGVCSTKWLGIPCAKKVFHGQESEALFLKEASILAQLNHPHIVNFICCGNGEGRGDRFIAMELMEKSLFNLIEDQRNKSVPMNIVVDIITQIARGMCYLHDQGVAHRDLKPQNVVLSKLSSLHLVDQFCVKLVDFGMSKSKVCVSKSNTISIRGVGTTRYRAPEVHPKANPDGKGKAIWFKADIYSFAMTCAHLLTLKTPFDDIQQSNTLYEELKKGLRPKLPVDCPEELLVLIQNCWDTNPHSRPSSVEICLQLERLRYRILRGFSTPHQRLEEDRGDCDEGFDFIKTQLEENSSLQKSQVVDTSLDQEEGENFKNDVVSIIPCSSGHALELIQNLSSSTYKNRCFMKFLPQSSYICNICSRIVIEEGYSCETCNFLAHKDCVEIKDKVEVFFHDDSLHLLVQYYCKNNQDSVCRFCKQSMQESEWVYRCDQCTFDVHALCTKFPKKFKYGKHEHILLLIEDPPHKSKLCTRCNSNLEGYHYSCTKKWCTFDLHPHCAIQSELKTCIFDTAHSISLKDDCKVFTCGKCGTLGYSWFYHCGFCDVDMHLDCVDDKEDHFEYENIWKHMVESWMNKESLRKMDVIIELLYNVLFKDASDGSSSSNAKPSSEVPTIYRFTSLEKRESLGPKLDGISLRKIKIAIETTKDRQARKLRAKEVRQELEANSLEKVLEELRTLENIVIHLQSAKYSSKTNAKILAASLDKLRRRQEEISMQVLSKIRQGPYIGLFRMLGSRGPIETKLLTSLQANMQDVYMLLLCEEPGHEHIVDFARAWRFRGELGERCKKLHPFLDCGLQTVTKALSSLSIPRTELHSVTLPNITKWVKWDLRDIEKPCILNPFKDEAENMEAVKKAHDYSREWLLCHLEATGCNIFKQFRLQRVRYKATRYTQGALAWLCTEHLNSGLKDGILESYPCQMYHNTEYDEQRGYDNPT